MAPAKITPDSRYSAASVLRVAPLIQPTRKGLTKPAIWPTR
jgi:hypothetical protein